MCIYMYTMEYYSAIKENEIMSSNMDGLYFMYTLEYYSAIKKNEILPFATT